MELCRIALAGAFVAVSPGFALAAAQPITIPSGQVIKACARLTSPELRPAVVCNKNIEVRGGTPRNGYTFEVMEGETLPPGVKLTEDGIVTATKKSNPPLPPTGAKPIRFTVTDGVRTKSSRVTLQMDSSTDCSCPDLTAGLGGELPNARGSQPYGVTLPVSGPPSNETISPAYTWSIICNGLPQGCGLPPGMKMDPSTGVLSGTPIADTSGHDFFFKVRIRERSSGTASTSGPFFLRVD